MFRYFGGMYCLHLQGDSLVQMDAEVEVAKKECVNCMGMMEEIWPVRAMEMEDWPIFSPTFPYN
jgi:Zn ribbon nucleic-acid-binding protein